MTWENLDLKCAKKAGEIIAKCGSEAARLKADIEKLTTETSAVLSQHGPYACALYLTSQARKRPVAKHVLWGLYDLLQQKFELSPAAATIKAHDLLQQVASLGGDLDRLLLAKKMMGQVLIYLRYHAKGLASPQSPKAAEGATTKP